MYFDANTNIFYIDTVGTGGDTGRRVKLNAWGAHNSYADEDGNQIKTTYLKTADIDNYVTQISLVEWNAVNA